MSTSKQDNKESINNIRNIHSGHRDRMRFKIDKNGMDSLTDIEFLEYVLFYVIPRGNTNELAHRLLDKFGSCKNVFNAEEKALLSVEGVGPKTSRYLKDIPLIAKRYLIGEYDSDYTFDNLDKMLEYLRNHFLECPEEQAVAVYLDGQLRLITAEAVSQQNYHEVQVNRRNILKRAMEVNSPYVVFAHNHPSGVPKPSADDFALTDSLKDVLKSVDIQLLDHIIICPNGKWYSFSDSGNL